MASISEKLAELEQKFGQTKNVNAVHRKRLSNLEKLALFITQRVGTMGFFFIIFAWTVVWLGWNIFAPRPLRFDPFPGFVLWLFISNLIQLHLMPLIMIGQNIQGEHAELRSEYDYDTDKRAAEEIHLIVEELEQQRKILENIQKHLK